MRTLMMVGSVAMIASGIFCLANGSATFISVAFVIGLIFVIMGLVEVIIGTRADFDYFGKGVNFTNDGIILAVSGVVIMSGRINDDASGLIFFGLWLLVEAVLAIGRNNFEIRQNTMEENSTLAVTTAMLVLSILMFFNGSLFNIGAIILVGIAMILLGLNRFIISEDVKYNRAGFLTGNEERLQEALEEEKAALAKAKEGIREQKAIQQRIEKIRKNMADEKAMLDEALIRKNKAEDERGNKDK